MEKFLKALFSVLSLRRMYNTCKMTNGAKNDSSGDSQQQFTVPESSYV
jgi:hypothetical protein